MSETQFNETEHAIDSFDFWPQCLPIQGKRAQYYSGLHFHTQVEENHA